MIIQGLGHRYEVIKKMESGPSGIHYLCRESKDAENNLWNIQEVSDKCMISQLIPHVMELEELGEAQDWREYILNQDRLYLVFPYEEGIFLCQYLEEEGISLEKRYQTGSFLLERLIVSAIPVWMKWEICEAGRIMINSREQAVFYYGLEHVESYGTVTEGMIWPRLAEIFSLLFQECCDLKLYPELEDFLEACVTGRWQTLLEGYQVYISLMPVIAENREEQKAAEEVMAQEKAEKEKSEKENEKKENSKRRKKAVLFVLKASAVILICMVAYKTGPVLWNQVVYPKLEAEYLVKTMLLSDPAAKSHTGRAELLYDDDGEIAWRGMLSDGLKTGYGISYYKNGRIEYEGNFEQGKRDGAGILYDDRGNICYEGGFIRGRFEGQGCLYENRMLIYEGGFSKGVYNGAGISYKDGRVTARGNFENGVLSEGTGTLVDEGGQTRYEGELEGGIPNGRGTDYEAGKRVYEGIFENGRYQGAGKSYSPDTGGMIYEGDFIEGQYSGEGKQYDPENGYLLYEGGFRLGEHDGDGTEYDGRGCLRYKGRFCLGNYQGYGTLYDTANGKVIQEGEFRNGLLVTSKEELYPEEINAKGTEPEETGVMESTSEVREDKKTDEINEEEQEIGPGIGLGG